MSKRRKYRDSESLPIPEPVAPNQESSAPSTPPSKTIRALAFGVTLPLQICGSLLVAVVLMAILLIAIFFGTFFEAEYGDAVARFAVYDSLWFAMLLHLLGVNIFCSLLVRFPWKPTHYPFVVAHVGILVLLLGCAFTWWGGEESLLAVQEGAATPYAVKMDHGQPRRQFEISTISYKEPNDKQNTKDMVTVPFAPGPFNWADYEHKHWFHPENRPFQDSLWKEKIHQLLWVATQWGGRHKSGPLTLPLTASVQIEVLEYLANSGTKPVAPLELSVLWKRPVRTTNDLGEVRENPRTWEPLSFDIRRREHPGHIENRGIQMSTVGGERINFFFSDSPAEVAAFRASDPNTGLETGTWGQVVLHQAGKNYYFDVERLRDDTVDGKRVPLGNSGFSVGVAQFVPRVPGIRLVVHAPNGEKENLALFADSPDFNVSARKFGVFGTYWLDPDGPQRKDPGRTDPTVLERMAKPRLDILQGPGRTLYYRFWTGRSLASSGEVMLDVPGKEEPKFTVAHGTPDEAEIVVRQFAPHDLSGQQIGKRPTEKKWHQNIQRVKLRVNVDGNEDIFWIRAANSTTIFPSPQPPRPDQIRYVYGKDRTVCIIWNDDQINLGFGVFLKRFEKRSEPGRERMPSHYSSLVDFVQLKDSADLRDGYTRSLEDFTVLRKDVLIQMNRPATFGNPTLGRHYWIYQTSFDGPYHPTDDRFMDMFDGNIFPWENKPRESLYGSKLSFNVDPGRGWKYLGCFLIMFGSVWLVWRRGERS